MGCRPILLERRPAVRSCWRYQDHLVASSWKLTAAVLALGTMRKVLVDANAGEGWWAFWSSSTVQPSEIVPIYYSVGPSGRRQVPPTAPRCPDQKSLTFRGNNLNPECVSCSGFLSVTVNCGFRLSGPLSPKTASGSVLEPRHALGCCTQSCRGRSSGGSPSPLSQSPTIVRWSYRLLKVEMFEEKLGPAS